MGNFKKVLVYKIDTDELVMEFNSIKECANYFQLNEIIIRKNISGKYKAINQYYYCKAIEKTYYNPDTKVVCTKTPKVIDVFEDDELIGTYDNVKLAANVTGVPPSAIYLYCCGTRKRPIKGYTFSYNERKRLLNKCKPVDLYDADTNELYMSFKSVLECADFLGLSIRAIQDNLNGRTKTVKVRSFYCKYKNNG